MHANKNDAALIVANAKTVTQNIHNKGKTYKSAVQFHFVFTPLPNVSEQQIKHTHTHKKKIHFNIS